MDTTTDIQQKKKFESLLHEDSEEKHQRRRMLFDEEKLENYIITIESAKQKEGKKSGQEYALLKRYDVMEFMGKKRLIKAKDKTVVEEGKIPPYYVMESELYDTIKVAHARVVHAGEKKTYLEVQKTAANVTMDQVRIFLRLCVICENNRAKRETRRKVVRPIISEKFGSRGQVDLIDMRNDEYKEYNYILHYQDNFSKFSILRAMKTKEAHEVAGILYQIFTTFGAPASLQSDNGREFVSETLVTLMKRFWPQMTIIHGKPRHPQSQGSVERGNQDIKKMLKNILQERGGGGVCNNRDWVACLGEVQNAKNYRVHRVLNMSPYRVAFGQDPPVTMLSFSETKTTDKDESLLQIMHNAYAQVC